MIHVFVRELTRLADSVEQELFRIERENRFLASVINGVIAGVAVALIAWLVETMEDAELLLFACLGSSASSVVFAPLARNNSLRSIVFAYCECCAVCIVLLTLQQAAHWPVWFQCFVAVSASVFIMRITDSMHPAAVGSAMAFIIYQRDVRQLVMLMLAIVGLLTIVKILTYIYLKELTFRAFGREFRRDYYGHEMTVTMVNDRTAVRLNPADTGDTGHREPAGESEQGISNRDTTRRSVVSD